MWLIETDLFTRINHIAPTNLPTTSRCSPRPLSFGPFFPRPSGDRRPQHTPSRHGSLNPFSGTLPFLFLVLCLNDSFGIQELAALILTMGEGSENGIRSPSRSPVPSRAGGGGKAAGGRRRESGARELLFGLGVSGRAERLPGTCHPVLKLFGRYLVSIM